MCDVAHGWYPEAHWPRRDCPTSSRPSGCAWRGRTTAPARWPPTDQADGVSALAAATAPVVEILASNGGAADEVFLLGDGDVREAATTFVPLYDATMELLYEHGYNAPEALGDERFDELNAAFSDESAVAPTITVTRAFGASGPLERVRALAS